MRRYAKRRVQENDRYRILDSWNNLIDYGLFIPLVFSGALGKKNNMIDVQTGLRLKKMKELIEEGNILEVGISKIRITNGKTLDCVKDLNPDILCDLNKEKIPIEDGTFDIIIAGEVLEHLNNPYKALREFNRILKDKGSLVITVPNICSLVNRIKVLLGDLPSSCAIPVDEENQERHIVDFNLRTIKRILVECGFKIEKITSNGIITKSKLLIDSFPASMGETLIIKARSVRDA